MSPNEKVTMKLARDELYAKLKEEKERHSGTVKAEALHNERRIKELERLIAQFDERIKD